MTDTATMEPDRIDATATHNQFVSFVLGDGHFAFSMEAVNEIVRVPRTFPVPLAPASLLGLFNLRGVVMPALDLRNLLSLSRTEATDATRLVIVDCGQRIGLQIDRVNRVMTVDPDRIESADSVRSTIDTEFVVGVIKGGDQLIQLLDPAKIIEAQFSRGLAAIAGSGGGAHGEGSGLGSDTGSDASDTQDLSSQLVSFLLGENEYAFEISDVDEIVRLPGEVCEVPQADSHVLGVMDLRDRLLPLVALHDLIGVQRNIDEDQSRVVVIGLDRGDGQRDSVGIVVDRVREVLRVSPNVRDEVPGLIAGQHGESGFVESVCRLDGGERLVSVLQSENLLNHPAVQAAVEAGTSEEGAVNTQDSTGTVEEVREGQMVVFRLADQEYGIDIEAVQEIIRVPEQMNRVPRTATYIEGMVNLRNSVLPVLDMRMRLGEDRSERNDRQRILVFDFSGVRTGFIVDSVSEVLRLPLSAIEDAPHLSEEQARFMNKVANLHDQKRMIMLLEPSQLLEEHVLDEIRQSASES